MAKEPWREPWSPDCRGHRRSPGEGFGKGERERERKRALGGGALQRRWRWRWWRGRGRWQRSPGESPGAPTAGALEGPGGSPAEAKS
eukprot:12078505-Alexandrium_andersonii.AAC.1